MWMSTSVSSMYHGVGVVEILSQAAQLAGQQKHGVRNVAQ